jgi:hypothetical protein
MPSHTETQSTHFFNLSVVLKESLIGLRDMVSANKRAIIESNTPQASKSEIISHFYLCVLQTDSKRNTSSDSHRVRTSYGNIASPKIDYLSSGGHRHAVGHSLRPTQFLQQARYMHTGVNISYYYVTVSLVNNNRMISTESPTTTYVDWRTNE